MSNGIQFVHSDYVKPGEDKVYATGPNDPKDFNAFLSTMSGEGKLIRKYDNFWADSKGHKPIEYFVEESSIKHIWKSTYDNGREIVLIEEYMKPYLHIAVNKDSTIILPKPKPEVIRPDGEVFHLGTCPVPPQHYSQNKTVWRKLDEQYEGRIPLVKGLYMDENGDVVDTKGMTDEQKSYLRPYDKFPLPAGTQYTIRIERQDEEPGDKPCLKEGETYYGYISNVEHDKVYTKRVHDNMQSYHWHNYVPRLGKSINKHSRNTGAPLTVKVINVFALLYPEEPRTAVVKCEEHFKGNVCGGAYESQEDGTYVCNNCGMTYEGIVMAEDDDIETPYDSMDKDEYESGDFFFMDENEETEGMASKYQGEQDLGTVIDKSFKPAETRIQAWEQRKMRNIAAFRAATLEAPVDETRAKERLHKKAEEHREVIKKSVKENRRTNDIYDSQRKAKRTSFRKAAVLAWTKTHGPITTNVLRKLLEEHGTPIDHQSFINLLRELVESGRITMEKCEAKTGNTNARQPYLISIKE